MPELLQFFAIYATIRIFSWIIDWFNKLFVNQKADDVDKEFTIFWRGMVIKIPIIVWFYSNIDRSQTYLFGFGFLGSFIITAFIQAFVIEFVKKLTAEFK